MGCGLPTDNNVHQVAQSFDPTCRTVYVDIAPIVAHGRSLLVDDERTAVITADVRAPEAVLEHPDTRRLIDFDEPVAVLFLSVGHHLKDVEDVGGGVRHAVRHVLDEVARLSEQIDAAGIPWQSRTPAEVDAIMDGLDPVEPGMVNLTDWRPDPDQSPLEEVPEPLRPYEGVTERRAGVYEYGGVLRKP